jgi:hypothetical protein
MFTDRPNCLPLAPFGSAPATNASVANPLRRPWSPPFLALAAATLVACGHKPYPANSVKSLKFTASQTERRSAQASFVDETHLSGIDYRWEISGRRPLNILQTIGNGCAFLDYNNDGNLDVLMVGTSPALFRGDGRGRFTNVTRGAGLDLFRSHYLGCAVGDIDKDGFDDVYLTAYGGGTLLHNEGGKRFRDVTKSCGLTPQPWATSATFFDADADGRLDLYVGNYVEFGPRTSPQLCNDRGIMTGCGPKDYHALRGILFHNESAGQFRDMTTGWKLNVSQGRTLGVAAAPFGVPSRPTLAIANDQTPGSLFSMRNQATVDLGHAAGMALAGSSVYGGMGIDWGDYDNDGRLDLVIATYQGQGKLVLRNVGQAFQIQDTATLGMMGSLNYVAFGAKWLDYDNDGFLDLVFANGHVQDNAEKINSMSPFANAGYRQPTVLYHNMDGRHFEDTSAALSAEAGRRIVGRGLATGDYDNDGKVDVLIVDSEGSPVLLHNVTPTAGHWLAVRLEGRMSNRDGYGAVLTARITGRTLTRHCHADGSYLSSSDKSVHFGLGKATLIDRLTVTWPSGHVDTLTDLAPDQVITVREGSSQKGSEAAARRHS